MYNRKDTVRPSTLMESTSRDQRADPHACEAPVWLALGCLCDVAFYRDVIVDVATGVLDSLDVAHGGGAGGGI